MTDDMPKFTFKELHDTAAREVSKRKSVYARLVEAGKLSQARATREINAMQAIADHFHALAEKDRGSTSAERYAAILREIIELTDNYEPLASGDQDALAAAATFIDQQSARIAELEKERDAAMAIIKKMLDDTKHFLSLSNGPQS